MAWHWTIHKPVRWPFVWFVGETLVVFVLRITCFVLSLFRFVVFGIPLVTVVSNNDTMIEHFLEVQSTNVDQPPLALSHDVRVLSLNDSERLGIARVICALAVANPDSSEDDEEIAQAMTAWGFQLWSQPAQDSNEKELTNEEAATLAEYARLLFHGKSGTKKYQTATDAAAKDELEQLADLMQAHPLQHIPESACTYY